MSELAKSVLQLINDHGETVTFRRVTEGAYNPATGATGAASTADESTKVAFVNYKDSLIDGANIQRGDRKALIAASGLVKTPQTDDQLIGVGQTVVIVSVQTVQSGGADLAYICQVRA